MDGVTALRQPGSTLKPFLYAQAIAERRLTAASLLEDSPTHLQTAGGLYIPQNYDRQFRGWVSSRTALGASLNVPAVRTLVMVSPDAFHKQLLLALAGAAFVDGQWDRVIWWSLPLFLVKEDLGLTVAAVGVALWLAGERKRGLWLGIIGVLGTVIVVLLVIPYFNSGGEYDYVDTLGGERGILQTLIAEPQTKLLTILSRSLRA